VLSLQNHVEGGSEQVQLGPPVQFEPLDISVGQFLASVRFEHRPIWGLKLVLWIPLVVGPELKFDHPRASWGAAGLLGGVFSISTFDKSDYNKWK